MGIINNERHVGVPAWNRIRYEEPPDTDKRRSQPNPESGWLKEPGPESRIVDDALWARVKARQAERSLPFWRRRRPSSEASGAAVDAEPG